MAGSGYVIAGLILAEPEIFVPPSSNSSCGGREALAIAAPGQ